MSYLQDCRTSLFLPSLSPSSKQEDIIHHSSRCSYCDPGVSSGPATAATLTGLQRKRLRRKEKRAAKKAAEAAEATADVAEAIAATHTPTPTPIIPTTSMELMETESGDDTDPEFPFLLTNEQAMNLSGYTYAQWMIHINRVRKDYSDNYNPVPPEVESFLRLPRPDIIAHFQAEVARLVQGLDPPDSHPPE